MSFLWTRTNPKVSTQTRVKKRVIINACYFDESKPKSVHTSANMSEVKDANNDSVNMSKVKYAKNKIKD